MANNQISMDGRTGTIGAGGVVNFGSDESMNVLFYTKSVHDPEESRQRGRPWNKAVVYVRIQHPGEKDFVDRPVFDDDVAKVRWARQWDAFERKQEQAPDGTPVECLFPEAPEIAANLHSVAIHTVQQLAGLTAHGLQTVGMGATQWQTRAKKFLEAANGGAGMHRLSKENERLKNSLETQANQIDMMKAQLDRLMAEKTGVPPAMIPANRPTLAQSQAALEPVFVPVPELSDEPLFVEAGDDGVAGPEITYSPSEPPKRRGRPPAARN